MPSPGRGVTACWYEGGGMCRLLPMEKIRPVLKQRDSYRRYSARLAARRLSKTAVSTPGSFSPSCLMALISRISTRVASRDGSSDIVTRKPSMPRWSPSRSRSYSMCSSQIPPRIFEITGTQSNCTASIERPAAQTRSRVVRCDFRRRTENRNPTLEDIDDRISC